MKVLGINAVFHDPAAALVVDGEVVAASEEERFNRRKHGHENVPFAAWEVPERAARWCLASAGLGVGDLDAVAYSYDPALAPQVNGSVAVDDWEPLRTLYAQRAPLFLRTALPGLEPGRVRFVEHHLAHAASAALASPFDSCAVMTLDGRGERTSYLAGVARGDGIEVLHRQPLPHSLGLFYEELTGHLGFRRSSDEYKVMAMGAFGEPRFLDLMRRRVYADGSGGFATEPVDWGSLAPPADGERLDGVHFDLAASAQRRLEEVVLELARWLHARTGERRIALAGGVALNCVANARLAGEGPFDEVWVQPASGDSGTALGAAMHVAAALGDAVRPMRTAALGRGWSDEELREWLDRAGAEYEEPGDLEGTVAEILAGGTVVGWFQGRSEYGPRALCRRSLLADPRAAEMQETLNAIKGRESFRPVAPVVLEDRAAEIFEGVIPSPYMLFTHRVKPQWRDRVAGVVHRDGTARIQTLRPEEEPRAGRLLQRFADLTGVPVLVNTSFNTAGRPIVDDPRDALEVLGSAPLAALAIGPFLVRR
ncbi:MAG TPA: carbamoyltransferase C-terminal domain-containing protein [Solirubrobacteraceae bacterium]|nr:carbamoyltransferase C-terminal domain-containing protein [Solirubrobacteraceae bacterium]